MAPYDGINYVAKTVTEGYNTDDTDTETDKWQDATVGKNDQHTHSIALADIPTVKIQNRDYIELFLDVNELGSDPYLAVNEIRSTPTLYLS